MFLDQYTARYERQEDHLWNARVQGVPEVHAAGRSLTAAKQRIRKAAASHGIDPENQLEDDYDLPEKLRQSVERAREARRNADEASALARELTNTAARELIAEGLSLRDAAEVLEVSHTRIQQLVGKADGNSGRA